MNLYAYPRVSSEAQADGTSLETQLENCEKYARETYGLAIPKENVYIEPGRTGANLDRPQLQALLRRVGPGDVIIVNTADRLTRNMDGLFKVRSILQERGAHCWSVKDRLDVATANLDDLLRLVITGWFSQHDLEKLSDQMKVGRQARCEEGEAAFGNIAPFGFRFVKRQVSAKHVGTFLEIAPDEAEVVKLIFDLFLNQGLSSKATALRLNELGIPSPAAGRGKPSRGWYHSRVRQILTSETYAGLYHWGSIVIPVPAIVTEGERLLAIARLAENARMTKCVDHLLAGKIRCGLCEHTYSATGNRYYCEGRLHPAALNMARCLAPSLRASEIEGFVWRRVQALASDPDRITRYLSAQETAEGENVEGELLMVVGKIKALEREQLNRERRFDRREIKKAAYLAATAQCEAELVNCHEQRASYETRRRADLVRRAQARTMQERLTALQGAIIRPDLPASLRREIVGGLLGEITVTPEKLSIAYKLTAGPVREAGLVERGPAVPTGSQVSVGRYSFVETFGLSEIAVCPSVG